MNITFNDLKESSKELLHDYTRVTRKYKTIKMKYNKLYNQ